MHSFFSRWPRLLIGGLMLAGWAGLRGEVPIRQDRLFFPVSIEGRTYQLEAMIYRPTDNQRHPLVVFSHGRNGLASPRDPNLVFGYSELCRTLAGDGHVVAYIIRRGYGNSDGPDSELQDTAVLSGLEAAKDYQAAAAYWREMDFVLPNNIVLMGQSQGGWSVLACTNVPMPGVMGVVNISGGTNYRLMGTGAITTAVQDHWVAASGELGGRALVSSFWIYSPNDQSISGPTALRMFNAYSGAGGWAGMLMLLPFGSNGHEIVTRPDLFRSQLQDYFNLIGFENPAGIRSELPAGTGGRITNLADSAPVTTPATSSPASPGNSASSGGGGGAPSSWFLAVIFALWVVRRVTAPYNPHR